ncbi:ATPase domain-containing protein [Granulicella sp. dw_53]|uniref:ATPase domain-containing protein n=1 Tax=Granulicella sp. dw_53 TaxID=2719792 RepID=UPI001BD69FC9|nr:ATPase domain-containing protein [Granulicella sp. dw_53]
MNFKAKREGRRLSTGCHGLDLILQGGLPAGQMYLLEGDPGTGKTTLAMQFMLAGAMEGEQTLYITLSESMEELQSAAASHGWGLERVPILELTSDELAGDEDTQYTVFHPSEVELVSTMRRMLAEVERVNPHRVVFDSLSELRLLAGDSVRYRRQLLALKSFFAQRAITVLILDDRTGDGKDKQLQSIAHGVLRLQKLPREYGVTRRNIEVLKLRGSAYREGFHDYAIRTEGVVVYPRVIASEHRDSFVAEMFTSNVPELDALLGGGLQRGTSNLVIGPTGVGKSTIAALYAAAATTRGERAAIFTFDELVGTLSRRCTQLGVIIDDMTEPAKMSVEQIDPAELSPGEFAVRILKMVDEQGLRVLVLDSLNGYMQSMAGEQELILHLHELLGCLNLRGVTTIMTLAQSGLVGNMQAPVNVSYLADCVILMRYFEAFGEVRQAISVLKNRSAEHERTIRELSFKGDKITVGDPLHSFQGILTGVPNLVDATMPGAAVVGAARE